MSIENEEVMRIICPCQLIDVGFLSLSCRLKITNLNQQQDAVLIKCEYCNSWQHAICFKIFDDANRSSIFHRCDICIKNFNVNKKKLIVNFLQLC